MVSRTPLAARNRGKSVDTSQEPDSVFTECPKISLPNQGILFLPNLDAPYPKLVEGGSSVCRDEDPPPALVSVSGARQLQDASVESPLRDALKVSDESPNREIPSVKPGSSGLVADPRCSEPLKTCPVPSYAAVVRKTPGLVVNSIAKRPAGDTYTKFAERSFYDAGEPTAFGQILDKDGRKIVSFSAHELEELVAPFKYTLVGKFSHGFPSMKTLRSIMGNLNLKDEFSVSLLEERHVLIRLCCEEDYTRLWCRQVWFIAGFQMRVFKWTPDFCPQVEAPYAPVWVNFPYLPVHLFDKRSLFIIASTLGKPLRIDSATADLSRASTPRVCVEVNLSQTLLQEVEINLDGKTLIQLVEYENIPQYCSTCKHLGHAMAVCKSSKKMTAQAGTFLSSPILPEVNAAAQQPSSPVQAMQQPAPADFDLDDAISLDSKGIITFTPGPNNPTSNPVNVSKIKDDILQSYDRFDDVTEVESVCITVHNDVHFFLEKDVFGDKNYYSEGDSNSDSAPIVPPPKKKVKKKSKKSTINPKNVDEWVKDQNQMPDQTQERIMTKTGMGKDDKSESLNVQIDKNQDHDMEMEFKKVVSKKKKKIEKDKAKFASFKKAMFGI